MRGVGAVIYDPAMRTSGTFTVHDFTAAAVPGSDIVTATPVNVATMGKTFGGGIGGRSATVFTAAFDEAAGVGTYVAMESFEGSLDGRDGAFNFVHSASTTGSDRADEYFLIVPGSGTGDLKGISGSGGIAVDDDGTHRIWFEYELG